jgi:hypothetical protein
MGFISAIAALCKAFPILERLFTKVADVIREKQAKANYDEKMDNIDAAIAAARGRGVQHSEGTEWSEGVDRSPPVPDGSTIRATVDEVGTPQSGRS